MNTRLRAAAAAPIEVAASQRGRAHHAVRASHTHENPVPTVLQQDASARYMRGPSPAVWPIMSLRSAYLPHIGHVRRELKNDDCRACGDEVIAVDEQLTEVEMRWQHICHSMFSCRAHIQMPCPSPLPMLIDDVVQAANRHDCPALRSAMPSYNHPIQMGPIDGVPDWAELQGAIMPMLLDPAAYCHEFADDKRLAAEVQALVAAHCLQAGALLRLRRRLLPSTAGSKPTPLQPPPPSDSDSSDDEIVPPWASQDPAQCQAPHTHTPRSITSAFQQSGPSGLHEADAPFSG